MILNKKISTSFLVISIFFTLQLYGCSSTKMGYSLDQMQMNKFDSMNHDYQKSKMTEVTFSISTTGSPYYNLDKKQNINIIINAIDVGALTDGHSITVKLKPGFYFIDTSAPFISGSMLEVDENLAQALVAIRLENSPFDKGSYEAHGNVSVSKPIIQPIFYYSEDAEYINYMTEYNREVLLRFFERSESIKLNSQGKFVNETIQPIDDHILVSAIRKSAREKVKLTREYKEYKNNNEQRLEEAEKKRLRRAQRELWSKIGNAAKFVSDVAVETASNYSQQNASSRNVSASPPRYKSLPNTPSSDTSNTSGQSNAAYGKIRMHCSVSDELDAKVRACHVSCYETEVRGSDKGMCARKCVERLCPAPKSGPSSVIRE